MIKTLFGAFGAVAALAVAGSMYLILRGPFFGGEMLSDMGLFASLIVFLLSIAAFAWTASKYPHL